jgi:hypothetical protein
VSAWSKILWSRLCNQYISYRIHVSFVTAEVSHQLSCSWPRRVSRQIFLIYCRFLWCIPRLHSVSPITSRTSSERSLNYTVSITCISILRLFGCHGVWARSKPGRISSSGSHERVVDSPVIASYDIVAATWLIDLDQGWMEQSLPILLELNWIDFKHQ